MRSTSSVLAFTFLMLAFSCSKDSSIEPPPSDRPLNFSLTGPGSGSRGELIEASRVVSLSQAQLNERFASRGLSARNGVHIYKIVYRTETPDAQPQSIEASGIVVLPDSPAPVYPWISLQHGTIAGKVDAPSISYAEGVVEASQGFVTVVADYLGFGAASEVLHPYLVEESYADAGIDMMRAARTFAEQNKITLGPLFLRGYSEGGYATMALQKAIEQEYATEFKVIASAPAAGPYDTLTAAKILVSQTTANPVNLPFVVLSYDRWLAAEGAWDLSKVLAFDPARAKQLFSGAYRTDDILGILPPVTKQLFKADLIDDFLIDQPQGAEAQQLQKWLSAQSLHNQNWAPATPTRLYHCVDDTVVPVAAARSAYVAFKALNPNSPVEPYFIPSPDPAAPYDHGTCPGIFASLQWFGEILQKLSQQ